MKTILDVKYLLGGTNDTSHPTCSKWATSRVIISICFYIGTIFFPDCKLSLLF